MDRNLGSVDVAQIADRPAVYQALVYIQQLAVASDVVEPGHRGAERLKQLYAAVDALKAAMPIVPEPIQGPLPRPLVPAVKELELHLGSDADLPKRYGAEIKRLGGSYNECRGHSETRFVKLPCTPECCALADELIRRYPGRSHFNDKRDATTVVLRGGASCGHVQYVKNNSPARVTHALERYERYVNARIDEGMEL